LIPREGLEIGEYLLKDPQKHGQMQRSVHGFRPEAPPDEKEAQKQKHRVQDEVQNRNGQGNKGGKHHCQGRAASHSHPRGQHEKEDGGGGNGSAEGENGAVPKKGERSFFRHRFHIRSLSNVQME
jgi:hypothetical protein